MTLKTYQEIFLKFYYISQTSKKQVYPLDKWVNLLFIIFIFCYFMKRSMASASSFTDSISPHSTASTRQCSICSLRITFPVLLIADFTADSCISTSLQSLPSSTMRRIDSRCPIALERRFSTAFVFV